MKLSSREKLLIGLAILLALVFGLARLLPALRPLPWLWPDRTAAVSRLATANRLVHASAKIGAHADAAASIEAALTLTKNANDRGTVAVNELTRVTRAFGIKPMELKPGLGRQEGGFWVLPVQLRMRASVAEIMTFVRGTGNRLPMTRIARLGITPKEAAIVEAGLLIEFLFPAWEETKTRQGASRSSAAPNTGERDRCLRLLEARLTDQVNGDPMAWAGLTLALTGGDDYGAAPPEPRFLGVVAMGDESMALLGLGSESWYLAPGESKAGIQLLNIGPRAATIKFRGQVRRLELASDFAVSPLTDR